MINHSLCKHVLIASVVLIIVALSYVALTAPDQRNGFQKIGDAISILPEGADKAARELQDRTAAEKLGDAVRDGVEAGTTKK